MSKSPLIQDIASSFAQMHPELYFVQEYNTIYSLNDLTKHLEPLDNWKLQTLVRDYLETVMTSNISEGTYDNLVFLLKQRIHQMKNINPQDVIFSDHFVLNFKTFLSTPYENQKVFYRIDSPHPGENATCPRFDKFLQEIFIKEDSENEPDDEVINLVQEMFGYYLLPRIEPPVAFFLIGEGANGKSTLLNVLEFLMGGEQFVMANSIENLTGKDFDMEELRFKRLNICSEEQSRYIKSDKFKAMIEGAPQRANIKFERGITFRPKTKHIFATNKMPLFDSIDYGLDRRIRIVPFFRRFLPHEADKTLKTLDFVDSVFFQEISGIMKWAIAGAKRLVENNYTFSESQALKEQSMIYQRAVSSVSAFIHENMDNLNDEFADFFSMERLYNFYVVWCKHNGKKTMASNNFRDDLRRVMRTKSIMGWDKVKKHNYRGYKMIIKEESEIVAHADYASYIDTGEEIQKQINF